MAKWKFLSILFVLAGSLQAQAGFVLTMGGDVNFNRNRLPVDPRGVQYGDAVASWESLTRGIRPLINGDLNFANIETVVTDSNVLLNEDKQFAFQSHPNSIRRLLEIGFNLFNVANNHTYDFGTEGMESTFFQMTQLQTDFPKMVFHGIDYRKQLLQPRMMTVNGIRVAFASISIADPRFRASDSQRGILHIRNDKDYQDLVKSFARTVADYKILSIHSGTEGQPTLDSGQRSRFEYATKYGGVNLIIGHHPHVVRPIQKTNDRFIFYSLGNYLMVGSANITQKSDPNTDWGMFSRLYLERDPYSGKVRVEALEVIPLTNTHARTTPMSADKAFVRIEELNKLAADQLGDAALFLQTDTLSGRGIYCADKLYSVRAQSMCSGRISF